MTASKRRTTSEHYARLLLAAWEDREEADFKSAVQGAAAHAPTSFVEQERMELIQDLASNLLVWKVSGRGEDAANLEAALNLMRHLARSTDERN